MKRIYTDKSSRIGKIIFYHQSASLRKIKKLLNDTETQIRQNVRFVGLEILEEIEGEDEAFVTFRAILKRNGTDLCFTEKSRFIKEQGRWLFVNWGRGLCRSQLGSFKSQDG